MKTSKPVLLAVALAPLGLLGAGLYFQHVENMLPCPLCIIQRYAFALIALICLFGVVLPRGASKLVAGLGMLAALSGASVSSYHLWVMAHPAVQCGRDPLETALNSFPSASLLPFLVTAEGMCTTEYAPILGLSMPLWALLWFVGFAIVLGALAFKRGR
jgi:disulfide bond formation protein DsbB